MENKEDINKINPTASSMSNKRILLVEKRIGNPSTTVKPVSKSKTTKKTTTKSTSKKTTSKKSTTNNANKSTKKAVTTKTKPKTKTTTKSKAATSKKTTTEKTNKKVATKKAASKNATAKKTTKKTTNKATKKGTKTKKAAIETASIKINPAKEGLNNKDNSKVIKIICYALLGIILICSLSYIGYKMSLSLSNKQLYQELAKDIENSKVINIGLDNNNTWFASLKNKYPAIQGYIKINGTNINYPVLKGLDNEYYLTHNYKNEITEYGSIFMNINSDLNNNNSNIIIYGHDMNDGQMFSNLIKYTDKEYYNNHKIIELETENGKSEYEIVCAFKSRVFYRDEQDVFRFYRYYNFENEEMYNEYIDNCKKLQLYDTGVNAKYGDQLLTLVTCEYSETNGRMVVIAKKK